MIAIKIYWIIWRFFSRKSKHMIQMRRAQNVPDNTALKLRHNPILSRYPNMEPMTGPVAGRG
ncbi:MAG: hypothetical protein HQK62_12965, partial [Desulfamplus sp.]|nr:hypothetical protein [Desulfamplus sp.]